MKTVLIVDDEFLVRASLRTLIPWESLGLALIGEAKNGKEALRFIQSSRPDLVLTDIVMPEMSGLDLIREVREWENAPEFIILSCHNEFEYVRQGLKMGARDYLLKLSMTESSLTEAIKGVLPHIQGQTSGKEKAPASLRKTQNTQRIIKKLLSGKAVDKKEMDAVFSGQFFFITAIVLCEKAEVLLNPLEEAARDYPFFFSTVTENGESVLIAGFAKTESSNEARSKVRRVLKNAMDMGLMIYGHSSLAGMSGMTRTADGIHQACIQAREAAEQGFYSGWMSINGPSDAAAAGRSPGRPAEEEPCANLLLAIENFETGEIQNRLNEAVLHIKRLHKWRPSAVLKYFSEVFFQLNRMAHSAAINIEELSGKHSVLSQISSAKTLDQLHKEFSSLTELLISRLNAGKTSEIHKKILKAKAYLEKHYSEEISLSTIGNLVHMNSDYFAHLFHINAGCTLIDYLTDLRIEKAKTLMQVSSLKIGEIAASVGYPNYSYFSRLFKKKTGITASDYIKTFR